MSIRLTFQRDGGSSYSEQPIDAHEPLIGALTLPAWALNELGDPDKLVVTLRRAGGTVIVGPPDNVIEVP